MTAKVIPLEIRDSYNAGMEADHKTSTGHETYHMKDWNVVLSWHCVQCPARGDAKYCTAESAEERQ
jgi:hypothetical protein